jgi:hypothetical protein
VTVNVLVTFYHYMTKVPALCNAAVNSQSFRYPNVHRSSHLTRF